MDGKPVRPARPWSQDAFTRILDGHEPGDLVRVKLYRGHRLLTVRAGLTTYPYTPAAG